MPQQPDQETPENITINDLGAKYKYFDYNDLPARIMAPHMTPEVYKYGVGWTPVESTWDFMHNYVPISKERLDEMVAKIDSKAAPSD